MSTMKRVKAFTFKTILLLIICIVFVGVYGNIGAMVGSIISTRIMLGFTKKKFQNTGAPLKTDHPNPRDFLKYGTFAGGILALCV